MSVLTDNNDAAGKPGNNTIATATNLAVLARSGAAASIHSATDVDYYKVVLDAAGTADNFFRINFTDANGDLDLLLYDAGGNLVSSSETRGSNSEVIRFAGLAAGTYYVKVQGNAGAVNNYTLSWDRTSYGLTPDNNDAAGKPGNNTIATATNLAVLARSGAAANIHSATDVDYYKVVLDAGGTADNFFRINFTDAKGDLDLLLYDAGGNLVSSSETRGSNSEVIRFAGLAAGTYYVKVQGNAGAVNNYTLSWDRTNYGPTPDSNDAPGKPGNDTIATATNLAVLTRSGVAASIHSATDVDYYKVVLDAAGTADNFFRINFTDAKGDLDLLLYDAGGNLVSSSETRGSDSEIIRFSGLAAGTYYVKVQGNAGAVNKYTLDWDRTNYGPTPDSNDAAGKPGNDTIATATNLAVLARSGVAASIHSATDVDYYKLVLDAPGTADNFFRINFTDADGDLDLLLYDAGGNLVSSSEMRGSDSEIIRFAGLAAGTYYVKVQGNAGAVNKYTLDWDRSNYGPKPDSNDAAGKPGNNTLATATNLAVLSRSGVATSIHSATDVDYYKFVLDAGGTSGNFFRINFTDADGDLDLLLYDAGGNLVSSSEMRGSDSEIIRFSGFAAGTYYVKVQGNVGAVNKYTLDWDRSNYAPKPDSNDAAGKSNDTLQTATNLNKFIGGLEASIHSDTDVDFFKLALDGVGTAKNYAKISFAGVEGDLDLFLYDEAGALLASSASRTGNSEYISLNNMEAGIYYLKVSGNNGALNTYALEWDRTTYGILTDIHDRAGTVGNNTLATATDLGSSANSGSAMSIHSQHDVDYYAISLAADGRSPNYAQIVFDQQNGNLDLQLLDANGNAVAVQAAAAQGSKRLDLSGLSAGAYYLRVSGVGKTANTYSLAWDSLNYAPVADAADAVGAAGNDTMGTATALTQTTGSNAALSIHSATDVDYYKLILDGVGGAANYARIDFQERDGKLELFLLDESGNIVRAASAGAGAASVDLAALAPGTYYLKVAGSAGATNNYTLSWDRKNYTPAADSNDAAGTTGNDTLASATILNKLANTGAQATIHTAADVDYYQLVLTGEGVARNFVRISFDGSMGNLALQLYDAAGQEIAGAVTGGVNEKRANLNGLAPGTYYVKVSSSDGSVNSYSLDWDRTSYAVAPDANDRPGTAGNDSIATATALNKLAGAGVQASIHTAADVDYYQLVLTDEGAAKNFARICFDGSRGNLALQLYDAAGQEITGAITDGVNEKRAELDGLAPGTYYVKVSSSDGSVNSYSLDWDRTPYAVAPDANDRSGTAGNDSIATATALNANAKSGVGATIHSATDVDYYALTLTKKGTTNNFFQINFTNADGNLDLALYDANGNEIMASRSAMADSERLNLAGVAAGVYYVKVSGANGDANKYTMSWDRTAYTVTPRSDKFENNNTIAKARALPFQAGSYTGATSISGAADVDYFKFSLSMRGTNANYFTISGINATGQVELTLVNAQGDLMRKAISLSRTSQKLDLAALDPGTYYIKISSPDGATANYNISWNCWSQAQNLSLKNQPGRWNEDRFEAETERLVTALGYSGSAPGVNIHDSADVDYYKITLMETGSSRNYAQINYDQSWGTLSLTLYDAAGNVIDISDSRSGSEKISMAGLAEGTYYAVVEAAEATNNNAYTFKWNRSPGQQIVQENTLAGFSNTLANLAITENAPWQSWSFSLYAEATVENYISVSCADPLAIRLRDAAGRIVFSANSLEKINLGGLQSGNYSLEIGPGDLIAGDASAYTLEYDLGVHIRGNKARGAEYSSLFAIGDNEYACISGYGNVTLADFQKGTWAGERLRSYDDAVYYDAEKCVQDRKDDNQCWAAVASNMLAYSGWGESGITSATGDYAEDIIYDAYNAAFPNVGGMVEDALRWFFGPNYRSYSNSPTASKAGNYLHMEGSPYITMNYMNSISAMDQLASALQAGMAVGLSISGSVRHAVTVWGYTFNAAKEKGTAGYYTGLFITDSDNAKNVADSRNAPDCLQLISISWNAAHNGYYTSYAGSNRLDRFYTLDQAANQQTADLTDAAYAQLPDDMLQEGRLDGLLAQAMEPTPAMFQAGAELAHDGRETRNTGMLCA